MQLSTIGMYHRSIMRCVGLTPRATEGKLLPWIWRVMIGVSVSRSPAPLHESIRTERKYCNERIWGVACSKIGFILSTNMTLQSLIYRLCMLSCDLGGCDAASESVDARGPCHFLRWPRNGWEKQLIEHVSWTMSDDLKRCKCWRLTRRLSPHVEMQHAVSIVRRRLFAWRFGAWIIISDTTLDATWTFGSLCLKLKRIPKTKRQDYAVSNLLTIAVRSELFFELHGPSVSASFLEKYQKGERNVV
jgi:hypothetical protein